MKMTAEQLDSMNARERIEYARRAKQEEQGAEAAEVEEMQTRHHDLDATNLELYLRLERAAEAQGRTFREVAVEALLAPWGGRKSPHNIGHVEDRLVALEKIRATEQAHASSGSKGKGAQ